MMDLCHYEIMDNLVASLEHFLSFDVTGVEN